MSAVANGGFTLNWVGNPAVNLQSATTLSPPNWQDVANTLGANAWAVTTAGGQKYFRLVEHP